MGGVSASAQRSAKAFVEVSAPGGGLLGALPPSLFCREPNLKSKRTIRKSRLTSLEKLASLVDEVGGEVVVGRDELVEAERRQQSLSQAEVGGATQQQQHRREVDVEAVRHDRNHVHVSHHLRVLRLQHVLLDHVAVHVHQPQEVQTHRRSQPAQHPSDKKPIVIHFLELILFFRI